MHFSWMWSLIISFIHQLYVAYSVKSKSLYVLWLTHRLSPLSAYYCPKCYNSSLSLTHTHTHTHISIRLLIIKLVPKRKRSLQRKLYLPISWQLPYHHTSLPARPAWLSAPVARGLPLLNVCVLLSYVSRAKNRNVNVLMRSNGSGSSRCSCCLLSVCLPTGHPSPSEHFPSVVSPPQKGVSSPSDVTTLAARRAGRCSLLPCRVWTSNVKGKGVYFTIIRLWYVTIQIHMSLTHMLNAKLDYQTGQGGNYPGPQTTRAPQRPSFHCVALSWYTLKVLTRNVSRYIKILLLWIMICVWHGFTTR